MNELIEDMENNQSENIQNVDEQLENIQTAITDELKGLKNND